MGNRCRPRKTLIESCYTLRVRDLRAVVADVLGAARPWLPTPQPHPSQEDDQRRERPEAPPLTTRGRLIGTRCSDGGSPPSVYVAARLRGDREITVVLSYIAGGDGSETLRTELAGLVALPQHLGGVRWLFACPDCRGRAHALYLPPGGTRFACRRCHRLTWASVQAPGRERYRRLAEALAVLVTDLHHANELRRVQALVGIELFAEQALAAH